jgi:hypothetical protein
MAFNWTIKLVETGSIEDLEGVICSIHWIAEKGGQTIYGQQSLEAPDVEHFVPFEEVTEEMMVSWLETKLNSIQIEATLDGKLSEIENIL